MRKEAKKTRSRIIAFLLTVCMAFSLVPTAFAASAEGFADVPSTAWYYDSVEYVVQHKYFEGTGETAFSPTTPMNRAMFVTVLARLDGAEVDDTVSAFDDVASGSWYAGAVAWAVENRIANGVGDNKFAPAQNVTRQDMASFMARYIEYYTEKDKVTLADGEHSKTFTDEGNISSYAREAVALCVACGLIDGYPDGSFGPQDTATRAQVAAVIRRLALLLETGKSDEEKQTTGSSVQVTTTESNDNKTAADFEKAAEQSSYYVTAGINEENHLTVNDDVTIDANAVDLTLNLNTANIGKLTINATSETRKTTKIVIEGDAASVQSLTINAPYATVENSVTVNGPVHIEAVSLNTFVNSANTGIITISGQGAVEDLQEEPKEIVVDTSSTVAVKGKSTEIKVIADDANLSVNTDEGITPKVESSASNVAVTVNTDDEVTIGGEIGTVTTKTTAPKLKIDGTVEKVEVSSTSGSTDIKVEGTGSVATMNSGTANVTVPEGANLSVDKVEASGGSITAPAATISTVKVAENASLELNAPVETVTAAAGAALTLNKPTRTIEAEGNLILAGSSEVTSIDVKAAAEITIENASLTVTQVTKTDSSANVTVAGVGATEEIKTVVTKAAKPGVSFEKPTVAGGDGKLTGVTDKMEYKTGTGAYAAVSNITNSAISVAPGTYQVRVAADTENNVLASEAVTVTIPTAVGVNHAEIQGTPYVGNTLTAIANADATGELKYEWKAGDAVIGSAKTLTLTDNHIGKNITVRIYNYDGTVTEDPKTNESTTSAATATVTVDKSTLTKLLDKAAEIQKGVTVKDDDKTESDVAEGVIFVSTSENESLTGAINNATTVKGTDDATSEQVAKAESALRSANDVFIKAKKTGTRNDVTVLKEDLAEMLGNAPAEASNSAGSTILIKNNAEEVEPGVQWVTKTAADAYSKVKDEAEGAKDDKNATVDELRQAITDLNTAITTYLKAIQKGAELDNSALLAAVNAAEINAASVEVTAMTEEDKMGTDVLPSRTWVTQTVKDAYTNAISAAKTTVATTQSDYNSALNTLNGKTTEFNNAKKAGTKDIIAPTVTGAAATLNGDKATVSFNTDEKGTYRYKIGTGSFTDDVVISTAGLVVFEVSYNPGTNAAVTVQVADEAGNTTDITVVPVSPSEADESWYNDTDTAFTISTAAELKGLASLVNKGNDFEGKTITLANNINLKGVEWTPIGVGSRSGKTCTDASKAFKGTFDGSSKTISGLKITDSTTYTGDAAVGLFGIVDGGTVKNLILKNVSIDVASNELTGAAIGFLIGSGTAENVAVSGTVSAKKGVGGIVGRMTVSGTIKNCSNAAAITSQNGNAGGIVGAAYYTEANQHMTITECENTGKIKSSTGGYTGGIVGLSCADVSNCINSASVDGNGTGIGGVVGEQKTYGSVSNCTNSAAVTNLDKAATAFGTGGIIGWLRYHGTGESGSYGAAAIITVSGNTNTGTVSGGNDAGGIIGALYNSAIVTGNTNRAESLSGTTFAAGIVGSYQTTETPAAEDPAENQLTFGDNTSTTGIESIAASCKDLYIYTNGNGAASVNNVWYDTLETALEAAEDGDTVTLLRDVSYEKRDSGSGYVVFDLTNKTLDLNGYTFSSYNFNYVFQGTGGTIKNGKMVSLSGGSYALFIGDEGETKSFTVDNVAMEGGINIYNATGVVLKNLGVTVSGTNYYAVWLDEAAEATIASGSYTTKNGSAVFAATTAVDENGQSVSSVLTVDGGEIDGNGKALMLACRTEGDTSENTGKLVFNGGSVTDISGFVSNNREDALTITGGTFSSDPTSCLAAGYKAEKTSEDSNIWTVSRKIWSDYPAGPADVSEMPSGVKITSLGEEHNHFEILLEDEEAFLYFTQVFDCSAAQKARQTALENKTVTRYPNEYDGQLNMWWGAYTGGITVKMGCDVDLKGMTVSTVKFGGSYGPNFDGQGHTISNAKMEAASGNIGFFNGNISVSNVTFDNFTVSATGCENAAVVVGYPTGATTNAAITNVTVKNSSVTGGRYAGAIAGHLYGADVDGCKVENTIVCGQYKVGGVAGQTSQGGITNCVLSDVTVKGDNIVSGKTEFVIGKIIGCWATNGGNCTNNTFTGGTTEATANIGQVYKGYTAPQE